MSGVAPDGATSTAPPLKVDPETLVLRARPGRVVRFRRGAIVAIAGLGFAGIIAATWGALEPSALRIAPGRDPAGEEGAAPPDALAAAPATYGDVPKLGPPLPGDLGRPILEHRREGVASGSSTNVAAQEAQAIEAERLRMAAEQRAAREAGVLVQLAGTARSGGSAGTGTPPLASPDEAGRRIASDSIGDVQHRQRNADLRASGVGTEQANARRLAPPLSPHTLLAGTVVAASLITGLNSDLPGIVTGQVTENVFDSVSGQTLLIPQGARLVGRYDSAIAFGQQRAFVVWNRILFPDGSSIDIDDMPASDAAGFAGLADEVDRHTLQILEGAALATLLGVGSELSFGSSESDLVRAVRESAQQNGARAGDQLVSKSLEVQPTITVRPGAPLRIVVNKDLVLRPWPMKERSQ